MSAARQWPQASRLSEVHAAYMVLGLTREDTDTILRLKDGGHLDLVNDLCMYASIMADMETIAAAIADGCYPGVFEYEVSEPFGTWYGSVLASGQLLSHDDVIKMIATFTVAFFANDHPLLKPEMLAALDFQYTMQPEKQ